MVPGVGFELSFLKHHLVLATNFKEIVALPNVIHLLAENISILVDSQKLLPLVAATTIVRIVLTTLPLVQTVANLFGLWGRRNYR
ncbi:hypothetical protein D3C81_1766230 [compost metagenome]